jgi:hypothetical protein
MIYDLRFTIYDLPVQGRRGFLTDHQSWIVGRESVGGTGGFGVRMRKHKS